MMEPTKFLPLFDAISQNLEEGEKRKAAVPFPKKIKCVCNVSLINRGEFKMPRMCSKMQWGNRYIFDRFFASYI